MMVSILEELTASERETRCNHYIAGTWVKHAPLVGSFRKVHRGLQRIGLIVPIVVAQGVAAKPDNLSSSPG